MHFALTRVAVWHCFSRNEKLTSDYFEKYAKNIRCVSYKTLPLEHNSDSSKG